MIILTEQMERSLADGLRRGDASCMRRFYDAYAGYLTAVCSRYIRDDDDVKDILQEALINIFSHSGSFSYKGRGSLLAWSRRIVVNQSLMFLRRKRPVTVPAEAALADLPDEELDVEGIPQEVIMKEIRALPDGYRTVFNLYVFGDLSHKEIAEKLGIGANTSASQLLRAKRALAKALDRYRAERDSEDRLK